MCVHTASQVVLWRWCGFLLPLAIRMWYAAKDALSPISPAAPKSVALHQCCFSPSSLKAFHRRLNLNVHFCCSWPRVSQVRRLTLNVMTTICWLSEMSRGIFSCGLIWFPPEIRVPFFGWHPENTCDFSFWNAICSLLHADLGVKRSVGKRVTSVRAVCHSNCENYRRKMYVSALQWNEGSLVLPFKCMGLPAPNQDPSHLVLSMKQKAVGHDMVCRAILVMDPISLTTI